MKNVFPSVLKVHTSRICLDLWAYVHLHASVIPCSLCAATQSRHRAELGSWEQVSSINLLLCLK